jgi:hypothetical protein
VGGVLAGSHLLQIIKSKTFRIAAIVALLLGLYALAGFLLVPRVLRAELMKQIPATLGVTPAVGDIRFNPFTFQLEVKDFSLSVPAGEKLLGFQRLFVDFELSSIWHRAYTFAAIRITAPSVNAIVARDGSLNLLQLKPKTPPTPPNPGQKDQPLPALRIRLFKVDNGVLSYDDRNRPSEFAERLEPINFELRDFTTGVEGGRFTFAGASKLGERIEWHGHLTAQPIESDGEFQVNGLQARTIWDYIKDRVGFAVNSGVIDLNATYKFSLKDAVELTLNVPKVAVSDLTVRPQQSDSDWITVPQLIVSGSSLDLRKRQAHAESVSLSGLKVVAWLEPDGAVNLLKLATAPSARTPPAGAAPAAPGPAAPGPAASSAAASAGAAASPPWQFGLDKFDVKDASISAEDRSTTPAAKVLLAPLALQVDGVSLDLGKPLTVSLETKVNDKGSVKLNGDVTPQPLAFNLSMKPANLDLTLIQPYIAKTTSMTLLSGHLNADVKVRYGAKKPTMELTGDVNVVDLHTVDNALRNDFINWERLEVLGLKFQLDPNRLDIAQIVARKPYARVIVEPDTTLNVKRILAGPNAPPTAAAPPAQATDAASAAPTDAPTDAPVAAPAATASAKSRKAAAHRKPSPSVASHAESKSMPFPMAIKKVVVHGGEANFTDLSIQPNFSAGIQALEGTVVGLSSREDSHAKVDLRGQVDAFSPVTIRGDVNPFSAAIYTDLALDFRNIELTRFNPYSGKFAGYNITKGKLTTELHYKVDGGKLDAQHHIVIEQLEFGDKTASKDAVSLPVKLAVALLKDRNGVIDLNVPVNGTLDDPHFKVWPIIWKVLGNILEKAVTAPFALLGSLFGGGPDLQFIDFPPGVSSLDAAGTDKIKSVVKALAARPQLNIDVPIATVDDLDRPALIEARLSSQVNEILVAMGGKKSATAAPPTLDKMELAARLDLLTQLYQKNLHGEPKYPDSIAGIKAKPEAINAKSEFLTKELYAHTTVGDAELKALGQQRAVAVQQALLTDTQIDPARVFLVANDKAKDQDGKVRLELTLK